jgi:hypothetical protein
VTVVWVHLGCTYGELSFSKNADGLWHFEHLSTGQCAWFHERLQPSLRPTKDDAMYVCIRVGHKTSPCNATFNDLLTMQCKWYWTASSQIAVCLPMRKTTLCPARAPQFATYRRGIFWRSESRCTRKKYVRVLISLRLSLFLIFIFAAQPKEFILNGLKKLEKRSHKCAELKGE